MSCNSTRCECCNNAIPSTAIELEDDVLTITIAKAYIGTPIIGKKYCILLRQAIPTGADNARVAIKYGTVTLDVFKSNASYFRLCTERCVNTLAVRYFDDPNHLNIVAVK